jgi:cytochrome c-type biogenesis protein CcmH
MSGGVLIGRLLALIGPAGIVIAAGAIAFLSVDPAVAAQTLEDQVYAIARELMCPVCGGQTVAESSSQLAVQMRDEIRDRLRAGQTREEIIAYFVGQFGEGVLAAPPARGSALLLWLAPPLALLAGLVILIRFVRRHLAVPRAV